MIYFDLHWSEQVRVALAIELTNEQEGDLTRLARSKRTSVRLAQRAPIVLLAAQGFQNKNIDEQLGVGRVQVARWRERYLESGLQGIERDLPRGAPLAKVDVAKLVELTMQSKPVAAAHWSTRKMAAVLEVSPSTVMRHWQANGLKPHLVRGFKVSRDPKFVESREHWLGARRDVARRHGPARSRTSTGAMSCVRMLSCARTTHLAPDAAPARTVGRRAGPIPHERRDGGSHRRRCRGLPCARACFRSGLREPGGGRDRPRRPGHAPVGASAHRAGRRRLVAAAALEVVHTEIAAAVMKRAHRRFHRWGWAILLLCWSAAVGLALFQRPAVPLNLVWPSILEAVST
jgi:transposase